MFLNKDTTVKGRVHPVKEFQVLFPVPTSTVSSRKKASFSDLLSISGCYLSGKSTAMGRVRRDIHVDWAHGKFLMESMLVIGWTS